MAKFNKHPFLNKEQLEVIPLEVIMRAKNDSVAYYKSVIEYYKLKYQLKARNSDTFLLEINDGDYIKGLSNFIEESGDRTSVTYDTKINIEKIVNELIKTKEIDLSQ